MKPKVSVLCMTYNHKNYIRKALDSILMQKTNFEYELIIHDDASSDGTVEILKEYKNKYPNIIKLIFQKENQFSKGKDILIDFMIDHIQGEYVAINEGDDYWTNENKLQLQSDFLDSNTDYTICFHPVKVIWENNLYPPTIFPTISKKLNNKTMTLETLLQFNFIQTNSVMYRWKLKKDMWPKKQILPCDYLWHLLHAKYGKIGYLPYIMSVYRRNSGGVWTGSGKSETWFLNYGILNIRFYKVIENLFSINKHQEINQLGKQTLFYLLKNKKFDLIGSLSSEFPEFWNKFVLLNKEDNINRKFYKLKRKYKLLKLITLILLFLYIIMLMIFSYYKLI